MTISTLIKRKGAIVLFHREGDTTPCPCRTSEGYRDPTYHKANPSVPECNDAGCLIDPIEFNIKGFVIPASLGSRRGMQTITQLFGQIQTDDHVGIFPMSYGNTQLNFSDWSPAGEEYIEYLGMRFIVVAWIIVPDPGNTSIPHHWEVGLRRINKDEFKVEVF